MATSNGQNNGNGNVEPGSQSASGQEHLPPRRPSHSAHASGSSTKAATASPSGKLPEVRDVAVMLLESIKRGQ